MAISQYSELKTAVANWLARSDLTSEIVDFITLTESRLAYGDDTPGLETPPLRTLDQEASTTLSTTSASVTLPTDFLEERKIWISQGGDDYPLDVWTPESQIELLGREGTSRPTTYSVEGDGTNNYLRLYPSPDATYSLNLLYYKKYTSFSADADTNWVLTNAPQVYLFSALIEGFTFTRSDQQAQKYAARAKGAIDGLNRATMRQKWGTAKPAIKVGHSTP